MPKLSINFEEILPHSHGNFKEQNYILESSIIIIKYCIPNKGLLEECIKEEHVEVTGAASSSV
jgi:hypothetical protein